MKFVVTAKAFDRYTGKAISEQRDEAIDTQSNELFKGTTTVLGVKKKYESFWNDLNDHSDLVFVQSIRKGG